jgi:diguanylate cyclase (GGDEF)-like protein/PAS domain S-box-containing protein
MKNKLNRYFRKFSLRQRFLVAPLLGLVVCSLLTVAYIYESQRQNALLSSVTEHELTAFNHYSEVFVNLTEQHSTLDDLFYSAAKIDEATLYDQAKQYIYKLQEAVKELEQALPPINHSADPDFAALRGELSANAQAYKKGVSAAVRMVTVNLALVPDQLARADERYTAMNRSFIRLLDFERRKITSEIAARVRQSQIRSTTIAFVGVSMATLLFFLSQALSRILTRSIETQIGILSELGAQAGAGSAVEGSDEVERMTQAIAAFKLSLLELRESERRFSGLLQNVELLSLMLDREGRITYCNDYLLRLTGWRHEEVIGRSWFELFVPPETDDLKDSFAALLANRLEALHPENEILTRSGERRLIRWNNSVLRSGAGDVIGTASIGEDITEQKRAEIRIKRLNRVYAVLSGINTLIVRARVRDELFSEACRIAVEHGQFQMAWIGVVDRSAMKIVPIASAGAEPDFLTLFKDHFSLREDAPLGNSMIARAVKEKKALVSDDTRDDPKFLFAKERIKRRISSRTILPLLVSDDVVGVLALYAEETGFFDEEEMTLLTELAGDIAFAIDHIDKKERLDYLAYYDALTGLANRALFHVRLEQGVINAKEQGRKLALVLLDIERFKTINDTLGRSAGDALIKAVAVRMTGYASEGGRLARIDADHFAIMVPEVQTEEELARLIEQRFREVFGPPFRIGDSELRVSAKCGIAVFPDDGADADALFRNAEAALKNAKAKGERYLFYTQTMNERVAEKLSLENQLRQALDKGEFVLHYQPKVNLASGKLTSAEALIRWNDPRTGLVPPFQFIPILEETGLIHEVGRWALHKAIEEYLRWRAAGLAAVRIAVNVSPLQLRNRGFIAEIEQAIGIDAAAAAGLELEITESLIMEDVKHSIASLQAIRAMGVTIAIDDFGTGFSSLSYLSKLPLDTLKIDRSFVIGMTVGPEGLALVSTIISLAHSLKLKVVAEGVETEEQSSLLRLLDCDEMQGFLFSKPVPVEIFETKFLIPLQNAGPAPRCVSPESNNRREL